MDSGKWMHYIKKIKPYNIQKGLRYLKHYGPKEFWIPLRAHGTGRDSLWSVV